MNNKSFTFDISTMFSSPPKLLMDLFSDSPSPMDIILKLKEELLKITEQCPEGYREYSNGVIVGENVIIEENVTINAPTVISKNAKLRAGAYIRGSAFIGAGAVVGHSTEIKNSILMDEAEAAHFNYVGDSILGKRAHLAAGVILSNLKGDKSNITIHLPDCKIDTEMRKLGSIIGDFAEIGCNCVLNPGCIIGRGARIYPSLSVRGYIEEKTILKAAGRSAKIQE